MKREERLSQVLEPTPFTFDTNSPGSGSTRYRFFLKNDPRPSYFGCNHSITAYGFREALLVAETLRFAHDHL